MTNRIVIFALLLTLSGRTSLWAGIRPENVAVIVNSNSARLIAGAGGN